MFENLRRGMASVLSPRTHKAMPQEVVPALSLNMQMPPVRGSRELMDMYSKSPWLRAIVNKVGKAVGDTQWRLYVMKDANNKKIYHRQLVKAGLEKRHEIIKKRFDLNQAEEILDHPLLDLLENGNEQMLGDTVFQLTQTYMDLVGEAFLMFERNRLGLPVALWPIPPTWIMGFPTADEPFYKLQPSGKTAAHTLVPVTEILMFKDPDPLDPYGRGTGIAKSLGDELEIDEYAAKHTKSFFYNRARPDIIVSGDNISADDAKRLEAMWLEKHRGFWRAFKPLFFSRKIDVKELTQTFENLQMVSLRKQERDTFISVFGAPPEKFGIVNESKRSTIDAADFFWTKDVIAPRMDRLRMVMQSKLVPMFDSRLVLDFDSPIVQDKEFQLNVMTKAPWAFKLNDWRAKADLPPEPDGNVFIMPINHQVVPEGELESAGAVMQEEEEKPEPKNDNEESEKTFALSKNLENSLLGSLPQITEAINMRLKSKRNA